MLPQDQKDYLAQKLQRQVNADTLVEVSRLVMRAVVYLDQMCKAGKIPEQDVDELEEMSSHLQKYTTRMIELGDAYVSD